MSMGLKLQKKDIFINAFLIGQLYSCICLVSHLNQKYNLNNSIIISILVPHAASLPMLHLSYMQR